ncbi:hypothetical protein METBIDRAFT_103995 [Metschnikowia bicuspidata var. bicuspidata NRRL YB-4993]|uniref:Uncharacterized protein n=1 Tax=Metschnikowia bicuspidata var. bicuspidata NRRL YB-4993 TaxID=869754 RepID=A0A1A0HH37_9ASCO|nr:hypothetical protein METBIDRAFT_103995 [Metschnikowia bicuspidata var. bicuspidata NRRL YB-4993]OBA23310.1 hypothetical protein METBIDRAFT_103995 [Metschnikowia bicuspidata var. bicuspidata NRRL YB-4993]
MPCLSKLNAMFIEIKGMPIEIKGHAYRNQRPCFSKSKAMFIEIKGHTDHTKTQRNGMHHRGPGHGHIFVQFDWLREVERFFRQLCHTWRRGGDDIDGPYNRLVRKKTKKKNHLPRTSTSAPEKHIGMFRATQPGHAEGVRPASSGRVSTAVSPQAPVFGCSLSPPSRVFLGVSCTGVGARSRARWVQGGRGGAINHTTWRVFCAGSRKRPCPGARAWPPWAACKNGRLQKKKN